MKKVVIVGGGPSGLMVAHQLVRSNLNCEITILDANKAVGRKFLVAGHGGFNLSNNKNLVDFVSEFNHSVIKSAVSQFTNSDTIRWLEEIGIESYIGSSGKLFPKVGIKPIQVLNAWLNFLKNGGIRILTEHRVLDFDENFVKVNVDQDMISFPYDFLVFAVGGSSWKSTGSNGLWITMFKSKGFKIVPFQSSNSGIELIGWNADLGGTILKNTKISVGQHSKFGDVVLTDYGLEGAPVYALSSAIRDGGDTIVLNFKPSLSSEVIQDRFKTFKGSKSEFLKSLKLPKAVIDLFKHYTNKEVFNSDFEFLKLIHYFPIACNGLRPIDEVISTVGGIHMDNIDECFECKDYPSVYCIGEMLDWDAPTGGYLLQACFASGFVAASNISKQIEA